MKFRMLALALCLFLLSGCADQYGVAVITTGGGGRDAPVQEESSAPESGDLDEAEPAPVPAPDPVNLFETLPTTYLFCSGAGGWSTELNLETDGSFTGLFHDSDMGVADTSEFPNGTMYICVFSGKFTQPESVSENVYSMRLESLELEHPADESEEIIDGVRYIYSGPYGLENAEEILIYLPDTPADSVSEDVLWAARGPYNWQPTEEGALGLTILFNVHEGQGFVQYPFGQE